MHVRAFLLLLSLPVISDPRLTYIVYLSAACPTTSSPFRILILCHLPRPKPVPGYWMLAASPRPPAWFYARLSLSSSWVTFYLTFLLNKLCCIWICLCPLIYYRSVTTYIIVWISFKNDQIWKLWLCNLLSLVCQCVVGVLFAPQCIFHCVRTWCVLWERHGMSDVATVAKGGGSLRRVNCASSCTVSSIWQPGCLKRREQEKQSSPIFWIWTTITHFNH